MKTTMLLVFLGCAAKNCDDCLLHNPVSCANCSSGYYALQKRIMGNVKCVRQCPTGFTSTIKKDGKKICKDTQSSKWPILYVWFLHQLYVICIGVTSYSRTYPTPGTKLLFVLSPSQWGLHLISYFQSQLSLNKEAGYRMVFASICEHASSAFLFASTSSDPISHASSEHSRNYKCEQRALRKISRHLESLFIKTLFCATLSGWHLQNRTTVTKLANTRRPYRGSSIPSSLRSIFP